MRYYSTSARFWEHKRQKHIYLVHALQTVVANFKTLDDFHLDLHEFNVLNLLTNISM